MTQPSSAAQKAAGSVLGDDGSIAKAALLTALAAAGVLATLDGLPVMTIDSFPSAGSATGITVVDGPNAGTNSNSLYGWAILNVTNTTQANSVQINMLYNIVLPVRSTIDFQIFTAQGAMIYWDSDTYMYPSYNGFKLHTTGGTGAFPSTGTYYIKYFVTPSL